MKTKAERKDIRDKDDAGIKSVLLETREAMRAARFGRAGIAKGAKSFRAMRKTIARAMTEANARRVKLPKA
jgi:ribosomal protein L29